MLVFLQKKICGSIGSNFYMGSYTHGGKIAYNWISPHPAKARLILGVVVGLNICITFPIHKSLGSRNQNKRIGPFLLNYFKILINVG